ncbi:MAG: type VI secretion system tube protein Hcp, partial [Burkholderiales bacterium]|nr:type VI secretion system tube protein Hcp [Burkholderiales bacterium]
MKDIYLKFDNPTIKGESQDKDHADWIEVGSWTAAMKQPRSVTASTAGGHTSERT